MNLLFRLIGLMIRHKKRAKLSIWDVAKTPFRVWPTDIDMIWHMNNGKYLSIMDLGRMDLMLRSGMWQKFRAQGWYPVVAAQTIRYRKSLKTWAKFDVHTKFLGASESGVYMEQKFCVGDEVYAVAYVRARFLKKTGGTVSNEELLAFVPEAPAGRVIPEWVEEWGHKSRDVKKVL